MTRYFDITDLIQYALVNRNVSGIQRVQIRVIRQLALQAGDEQVICLFAVRRRGPLRGCSAAALFADETYDAGRLLHLVGMERAGDAFTKQALYDYLHQYPKRSLLRAIKKAEMLFLRKAWPAAARRRLGQENSLDRAAETRQPTATWPVRNLQAGDALILLGTNWDVPAMERVAKRLFRQGGEVVQVIYDLIPYRHPEYCVDGLVRKFNRFLLKSVRFTSRYICISEATRRDMDAFLTEQRSQAQTATWPLAHEFAGYERNTSDASADSAAVAALAGTLFVLCVGTIEVRKNGIGLLRAWRRVVDELGDQAPLLVFAGKYGWKIADFHNVLASDKQLAKGVRVLDRATDADLAFLYQRCLFHVYPSFVEGWGLPVGEAAWFGKYSVVSSRSSLPEVCGELVDYVDPTDAERLAATLLKAIADPAYRRGKEAAIASAPLRSWDDTARHLGRLLAS